MESVADSAYVAYRSLRARLRETIWPPEVDPLCAILLRRIWMNGNSIGIALLRIQLALPLSTLSTALRRAEDRGYVRRYPNIIDARFIDVALTQAGQGIAKTVTDLITELEVDVGHAAGGAARYGFSRVAWMLAAMDDETETAYGPFTAAFG